MPRPLNGFKRKPDMPSAAAVAGATLPEAAAEQRISMEAISVK
jgi:hypothetical protein